MPKQSFSRIQTKAADARPATGQQESEAEISLALQEFGESERRRAAELCPLSDERLATIQTAIRKARRAQR